jgi:hypothetical protein
MLIWNSFELPLEKEVVFFTFGYAAEGVLFPEKKMATELNNLNSCGW